MRKISEQNCSENQNTHFMFSFFKENRAVCEIIRKKYFTAGHVIDEYGA
jgi:hypothetical protein